jgi:tRNA A-37 threonylcarbamoyl transferase component Bud32
MNISLIKRISRGGSKGWISEEILPLLPSLFFRDPPLAIQEMNPKVLRESRLRWAAIFCLPNQQRIFLKRDRTKGWFESLKYLFLPSKAPKEWFIANQLQKRKLPIPRPLGWIEKIHQGTVQESYYLSEAIGSGVSLIEEAMKLGERFPLLEMAKTVKRIHQEGLIHSDLHAGNFLWNGETLFLIDLHSAKIVKNPTLKQRLWNLSLLFHSLRSIWGEVDQTRFMNTYFEGEAFSPERKKEFLQKVHSGMEKLQKKQWRSRTKRCLKESTEFSVLKKKGLRYYHRRDFPLDLLEKMVEKHLQLVLEKPSTLTKYSSEVTISILENGGNKLCVKNYRPLRFWDGFKEHFRRSKGLKAWVGGNGLRVRGIPSLKPLGLMERKDWSGLKQSSFLMEVSDGDQELDRYILTNLQDFKKRRRFVKAFAQWFSHYHQMGLYHKDMKTCNILVSPNGEAWNFHLLDLEDVRLDEKVEEKQVFRSFLQLNTSIPKMVTTTDRFRFLRAYLRPNPVVKDRKSFLRRLIHESKRREVVYVAPWGVVTEKL